MLDNFEESDIYAAESFHVDYQNRPLPDWPPSSGFEDESDWLWDHRLGDLVPAFLTIADKTEFLLQHLGEVLPSVDNVGPYTDAILSVLRKRVGNLKRTLPAMMTKEEQAAFARYPEQITIFRGCGPRNRFGFSFSLNQQIARSFPLHRAFYRTDRPTFITATISKHRAAALKLERGEEEIIVFDWQDDHSVVWTEMRIGDG